MTETPNGVKYTTREALERIEAKQDRLDERLRSVELKVAASRWVGPILTGVLVALLVGALARI